MPDEPATPDSTASASDDHVDDATTADAPPRGTFAWVRWGLVLLGALVIGAVAWSWTPDDAPTPPGPDGVPVDPATGDPVEAEPEAEEPIVPIVIHAVPSLDDRFVSEPCNRIPGGGLFSVRAALDLADEYAPEGMRVFMGDLTNAPGIVGRVTAEYHYTEVLPETRIDVVAAGGGELGLGSAFVRDVLARTPSVVVLCANALDAEGFPLLRGWSLYEAGNHTVLAVAVAAESVGYEMIRRSSDVRIGPAIEAAKQALADADARALDLERTPRTRLLLVHGTVEEAEEIAAGAPGFDVVVASDGPVLPELEPRRVGDVPVYFAGRGARFIWRIIRAPHTEQKVARLARIGGRVTTLGSPYNSRLAGARAILRRAVFPELGDNDDRPVDPRGEYVGSTICADCHPDEHSSHLSSRHAAAPTKFLESDFAGSTGCVGCHLTAPYSRGGWLPEDDRGIGSVGCESCHGPGGTHVDAPEPGYGAVDLARCYDCHLPDRTPNFAAEAMWERAGHGALPPDPGEDD